MTKTPDAVGGAHPSRIVTLDDPAPVEARDNDHHVGDRRDAPSTEKKLENSNVYGTRYRVQGTKVPKEISRVSRTLPLEEFRKLIASENVEVLRAAFPKENTCHRDMLNRQRAGTATVHPDLRSFKQFLHALGRSPSKDHTVDRIDAHDPEYAPGKVRWADKKQQANNKTNTIYLIRSSDGLSLSLMAWAERTGQKAVTLRKRRQYGWTDDEVISGKRNTAKSKEQPPCMTGHGWPEGCDPVEWERAYRLWLGDKKFFSDQKRLKEKGRPPVASRALFYVWRARAELGNLSHRLEARWPAHFSPESIDPNDDMPLPPEIKYDPGYNRYLKLRAGMPAALQQYLLEGPSPFSRELLSPAKQVSTDARQHAERDSKNMEERKAALAERARLNMESVAMVPITPPPPSSRHLNPSSSISPMKTLLAIMGFRRAFPVEE